MLRHGLPFAVLSLLPLACGPKPAASAPASPVAAPAPAVPVLPPESEDGAHAKYGDPDVWETNESVGRWSTDTAKQLVYQQADVALCFVPDYAKPAAPPFARWRFAGYVDAAHRQPLDPSVAQQRLAQRPAPAPLVWIDASAGPVRVGDVQVRVTAAKVETIALVQAGKPAQSKHKRLALALEITNLHATGRRDYHGWAARSVAIETKPRGQLHDELGNHYLGINFGSALKVAGQHPDGSALESGTPLTDLLVFEPPLAAARFLLLELPGAAVGESETFRLRLRTDALQR